MRCELSKWGGGAHWEYDAIVLGDDEHGTWLGFPGGTHYSRPGKSMIIDREHVGLVPAPVAGQRPWHLATFYATAGFPWPGLDESGVQVYVDVTTPAEWDGPVLRAVDLDLDVVRGFNGAVIIDDEDEFLEHQAAYSYPTDVVTAARVSADTLAQLVEGRAAPYDGTHLAWLEALLALR